MALVCNFDKVVVAAEVLMHIANERFMSSPAGFYRKCCIGMN